ncbi:uncharacterized protein LOC122261798 [Penaeus japonicus]|uniref:uncharacterized protein LOC122261798 n=1 Tax=Penaeus japonicus TaxID=27405 RepID=UPI001C70E984|nr:uncharacterized protein LOC122261798 [Penaeus japonicus]
MKVVESVFEGVPQLCIQVATLWIEPEIGLTDEIKIMVKVAPLAFALLTDFSKDMPFLWRVINCLPVALVLGARLFVLVSLFALRDAYWLTCFIPPFLGFFAAWLLSHEQGSRRVTEALVKTLLYPPSDRAGIVPSAMYVIVYGLAVFLDPNSESTGPYWVLLFHIVGGFLWWFVLENKYKRA